MMWRLAVSVHPCVISVAMAPRERRRESRPGATSLPRNCATKAEEADAVVGEVVAGEGVVEVGAVQGRRGERRRSAVDAAERGAEDPLGWPHRGYNCGIVEIAGRAPLHKVKAAVKDDLVALVGHADEEEADGVVAARVEGPELLRIYFSNPLGGAEDRPPERRVGEARGVLLIPDDLR
jgi:hypothetical protein